MAQKTTADNIVNERRLRPIYDCLDNANYRKALQEADKLLKKQKDFLCAKVLKSLALLRLGKFEESLEILSKVHKEKPTDDTTLQAMTICYRELNKVKLIADAYENASSKEPHNEELLTHLFMAYVRIGEYKKQQQTAMNLYKLKPKNPYYFWYIMSLYMQAISSDDTKVLLSLAQKMTKKFVDENKIEAEAEVELYLMILEKQEKYEEMLKVINGSLGLLLASHSDFLAHRKAMLCIKMSLYHEAFDGLRDLIENNLDQLEYYLQLFDVAFILDQSSNISESNDSLEGNKGNHCIYMEKVIQLLDNYFIQVKSVQLNDKGKKFYHQRGPYLARIELLEFLKNKSTQTSYLSLIYKIGGNIVDFIYEFYTIFGHKGACFYDLCYIFFKYNVPISTISSVIEKIKCSTKNIDDCPTDIDSIYRHLCYSHLNNFAGKYCNAGDEERLSFVSKLIDCYDQCINIGTEVSKRDFHPADLYILLISYVLLDKNIENNHSILMGLIVILEKSLRNSPTNFSLKLSLLKLYNLIGAVGCSYSLFESMDIKHLQLDTLGYLVTEPLLSAAHFSTAENVLVNASRFNRVNSKDTIDCIISCYKYGSFTKIEEIMRLKERLNLSLHFSFVDIEKIILDIIFKYGNNLFVFDGFSLSEMDLEKPDSRFDNLCDNRDFSIYRTLDPISNEMVYSNRKRSFEDNIKWIKLRDLFIRTLITGHTSDQSPCIKENGTNGTKCEKDFIKLFSKYLNLTKDFYNKIKEELAPVSFFPLQGPQPSRLNSYLAYDLMSPIILLFDQLYLLYESSDNSEDQIIDFDMSALYKFKDIMDKILSSDNLKVKSLVDLRKLLENLVNLVEVYSFIAAITGLIYTHIKTRFQLPKKARKKKGKNEGNGNTIVLSFEILSSSFEDLGKKIVKYITAIEYSEILMADVNYNIFSSKSGSFLEKKSIKTIQDEVTEKINQSYIESIKGLIDFAQKPAKYFSLLKF